MTKVSLSRSQEIPLIRSLMRHIVFVMSHEIPAVVMEKKVPLDEIPYVVSLSPILQSAALMLPCDFQGVPNDQVQCQGECRNAL